MIVAYILSCILLAASFALLRVWPLTLQLSTAIRRNLSIVLDREMSDADKERALRSGSVELLRDTVLVSATAALTLLAAFLPVALGRSASWFEYREFLEFSLQPSVVILTLLAFTVLPLMSGKLSRRT